MPIIIFIISLALLILVHELGHFLSAKIFGIRVDEFGLGLPPRAWGKRIGETVYSLNWIPFGGFVKIFGEDPASLSEESHAGKISSTEETTKDTLTSVSGRAMYSKPKWIQAIVLVAGVTFNVVFAWFLLSLGFMIGLPTPASGAPGKVENPHVVIISVLPDSPAAEAGLRAGDTIVSVATDRRALQDQNLTPDNISAVIDASDSPVGVTYHRGKEPPRTILVQPSDGVVSGKKAIGISMETIGTLKLPFGSAIIEGAKATYALTVNTAKGLASFLAGVVTLNSDLSQVTGPVGLAGVVGEASDLGFTYLISLIALISINLAVINLVPFPALDGGRLLFILIEAIIRRPIKPAVARWTNAVGFAILLLLMTVITFNDILKLF